MAALTETELLRGSQLQARAVFGGFGRELRRSAHHLQLLDKASSAWAAGDLEGSSPYKVALGNGMEVLLLGGGWSFCRTASMKLWTAL